MSYMDLKKWPILSLVDKSMYPDICIVIAFGSLGNEALLVTKQDNVYAVGCNGSYCSGIGSPGGSLVPREIKCLQNTKLKTIACGSGPHVLALSADGVVYAWGANIYKQAGSEGPNDQVVPFKVELSKIIIDIACGAEHSLALASDGSVYAWGRNNVAQLGRAETSYVSNKQKVSGIPESIVSIACGYNFSVAVSEDGTIYYWGNSYPITKLKLCPEESSQQLGRRQMKKVVCGYSHILALTDEGYVYVWGGNSNGELGCATPSSQQGLLINLSLVKVPSRNEVGDAQRSNSEPVVDTEQTLSDKMGFIVDIAAHHSCHISAAINMDRQVFMWGNCRGIKVASPECTPFDNLYDVFAAYAVPSVMHRPLFLSDIVDTSMPECIKLAFDDPETSDLIFKVDGKPIHVHKCFLQMRSTYFKTMFKKDWTDSNLRVIEYNQFNYDVYKAFFMYLYTGEVKVKPEDALDLMAAADMHVESSLRTLCANVIIQGVSVENALTFYIQAKEYNCEELREYCFNFALNHMTAIVESPAFQELDAATMKDFVISAAKYKVFTT